MIFFKKKILCPDFFNFPVEKELGKQFINKLLTFIAPAPEDHTINFTPSFKIVKEKSKKNPIINFEIFYFFACILQTAGNDTNIF